MSINYTFDSEAILAFYLDEEGADVVEGILEKVQNGVAEGNINIINFAEIYYILSRANPKLAKETERKLRLFGLRVIPIVDDGLWRQAAQLKSNHSMSLTDAFAIATAKAFKNKLVVGNDKEFSGTDVSLLRIRK